MSSNSRKRINKKVQKLGLIIGEIEHPGTRQHMLDLLQEFAQQALLRPMTHEEDVNPDSRPDVCPYCHACVGSPHACGRPGRFGYED